MHDICFSFEPISPLLKKKPYEKLCFCLFSYFFLKSKCSSTFRKDLKEFSEWSSSLDFCSLIEPFWAMQAAFGKMPLRISGFFSYLLLGLGLVRPLFHLEFLHHWISTRKRSNDIWNESQAYPLSLITMKLTLRFVCAFSLEEICHCRGVYIYLFFR